MKTVITSTGNTLDSNFDLRFGRAAYFCVYDEETEKIEFIENIHSNDQGGAGSKASEKMIELGVTKIISGDFGPKAMELLDQFKIRLILMSDESKKVSDILNLMKK
jgi:predicted Fe-Mo cluster-binding NifX family protein